MHSSSFNSAPFSALQILFIFPAAPRWGAFWSTLEGTTAMK
jgi:hypothetical protein